jgi:multicomponent Na+:H+ antiporter subunit C
MTLGALPYLTVGALPYLLALVLMLIGLYVIVAKKNIIKIILGVMILEYGINLFLLLQGYRAGGAAAPIRAAESGADDAAFAASVVDPVPQALILTSIVIGVGCLALMVAVAVRLYERFGTFDMTRIRELRG